MRISTQASKVTMGRDAALKVRSALRGGGLSGNHNEALRAQPARRSDGIAADAGESSARWRAGSSSADNEALEVKAVLKAGGTAVSHNEGLVVRTAFGAEGPSLPHTPMIRIKPDRRVGGTRGPLCPKRRREDRLELMVAQPVPRTGFARRLGPAYTRV